MKFQLNDKVILTKIPTDKWCGNDALKLGMVGVVSLIPKNKKYVSVSFGHDFNWDVWVSHLKLYKEPPIRPKKPRNYLTFRG